MARRFSDIERGPELAAEYEKLQDWRKLPKAQKKALYTGVKKADTNRVKTERGKAWVIPFGAARTDIFYETRNPIAAQEGQGQALATLLRTLATGRVTEISPTGATATIIEMTKFQFAQIRASTKSTQAAVPTATSRITGRPYNRVYKDAMSINFGQLAAGDDYFTAVKLIKANSAYSTFANVKGNSISFKPEGS